MSRDSGAMFFVVLFYYLLVVYLSKIIILKLLSCIRTSICMKQDFKLFISKSHGSLLFDDGHWLRCEGAVHEKYFLIKCFIPFEIKMFLPNP